MHIRDIMKILHQIPGKKSVKWATSKKTGSFEMEDEFVTSISVTRLAKLWLNEVVTLSVKDLKTQQVSHFKFA